MNEGGDASNGSIGVLICDDVHDFRGLLAAIVRRRPGLHAVGEAADGEEAIAEAERLQPDVILLDLSMPRMTGLDALPEIRRVAPNARVIVLSGFAEAMVASDALAQGAHCYLEKGVRPEVIVAAIEEAVAATAKPSVLPARRRHQGPLLG
ncbi:MAG: response regulator transcription factor [Candidatus Dormibacteria bacterium]